MRFAEKWLDMIKSLLPVHAEETDSRDYTDASSSVNLFLAGAEHDKDLADGTNVDTSWLTPLHDLVKRAVEAGHGVPALTEPLRKPQPVA